MLKLPDHTYAAHIYTIYIIIYIYYGLQRQHTTQHGDLSLPVYEPF